MGSGAPGPQVGARQQELAQIQEKKERRNQKESEKASSTWLHLLAASARPRSPSSATTGDLPTRTHLSTLPLSQRSCPPLVGQAEKNELIKSERSRDAPLLNEKPDTVLLLLPS